MEKVLVSNANAEESYEFWLARCKVGVEDKKKVMIKIVNLEKSDEGMLNIVQKEVATSSCRLPRNPPDFGCGSRCGAAVTRCRSWVALWEELRK